MFAIAYAVHDFIYEFIKFAVVGTSGLIIDFETTYVLKEKARVFRYLASSAGFILAASSNYILNRLWTFHSTNPQIFFEYSTFIIISVIGLGINNTILWIFSDKWKQNFYLSKLIATVLTIIWNFLANFFITFH
jgi:putative flippase GtrA